MAVDERDYSAFDRRRNVVVTLPADHVSVGIGWWDAVSGTQRFFNAARVPEGTVVGGFPVGGWEFYPGFVNGSPLGEAFCEVPLPRGRQVWLQRPVVRADGQVALDGRGHRARETVKVDPEVLAAAIAEAAGRGGVDVRDVRDVRPLAQRAGAARLACVAIDAQGGGARAARGPVRDDAGHARAGGPAAGR